MVNIGQKVSERRSFLWSLFSCVWSEYEHLLRKSTYSVQVRENTYQKNFVFWHFSRSVILDPTHESNTSFFDFEWLVVCWKINEFWLFYNISKVHWSLSIRGIKIVSKILNRLFRNIQFCTTTSRSPSKWLLCSKSFQFFRFSQVGESLFKLFKILNINISAVANNYLVPGR